MTTTTTKTVWSLHDALEDEAVRRACTTLDGLPVGGWPETQQAIRAVANELPLPSERSYTLHDLLTAAFSVGADQRYHLCFDL